MQNRVKVNLVSKEINTPLGEAMEYDSCHRVFISPCPRHQRVIRALPTTRHFHTRQVHDCAETDCTLFVRLSGTRPYLENERTLQEAQN